MTRSETHDGDLPRAQGVLGRGPAFWAVMLVVSLAGFFALAFARAVDTFETMLLLSLIPIALTLVMMRALFVASKGNADIADGSGQAQRRYIKRVTLFTSLYLATFAVLMLVENGWAIDPAAHYAIAVMPGLAIIGTFWAIGRLIVEEPDEFIRMLTIRQTLIASALALSAASVWGFLEYADLAVHIDAYWYAAIRFVGLIIGAVFNRIEHGTRGVA